MLMFNTTTVHLQNVRTGYVADSVFMADACFDVLAAHGSKLIKETCVAQERYYAQRVVALGDGSTPHTQCLQCGESHVRWSVAHAALPAPQGKLNLRLH